jgi:hypothetical protein
MSCNLERDSTGAADFKGTTGKQASLSLKGTAGVATMTAARYAGNNISINPATFTIQSGDKIFDMTVDNTLPGDLTLLVCDDDGSVLHRFRFDRNNPAIFKDVRGI